MTRLFVVLALVLATSSAAATLTPERAVHIRRIGNLAFSPDGARLACVVSEFEKGKPRSHLWKMDLAGGGELARWTTAEASDRAAQWAPDGKSLAFLSTRAGASQIFVIAADSGEASVRALTNAARGVSAFRWAPDGKQIAFLTADSRSEGDPQVYDDPKDLERVWLLDVASKTAKPLTAQGWWRFESLAWAGPMQLLCVATNRPQVDSWTDAIYGVSPFDGSLHLLSQPAQPLGNLSISPKGSYLAYVSTRSGGPNPHDLFLQPLVGLNHTGPAVDVTADVDRPVKQVKWQNESVLYYSVTDGFFFRVYRLERGKPPERIDLPLSARDFDVAKDGTIAYAGHAFDRQAEVYLRAPDGTTRQVSHVQEGWDDIRLAPAEIFRYKSFDGKSIEAALLSPAGAQGKLPLVLLVHGGPGSSYDASSTYWFGLWPQLLVAHGYQVLMVNPRGSEAYGEEFLKLNRADWGGGDYKDLMGAVDAVVARGHTDPKRLGIGGWSYGGYMSQWAPIWTQRFRAAVAGAGTFDLVAEYETEDGPAGDEWYFGTPWEHPERYDRSSPNRHIRTARTPTLILHGEDDPANPVGQSIGYYRALKRSGVPCELVVYPREGHLPREEAHQIDMMTRMLAWFDRWLAPAP